MDGIRLASPINVNDASDGVVKMLARGFQNALTLDGISHSYGNGLAVDGVTLEVRDGELMSLVGPSGCGKSTLLRIIAGFVRQSAGRVIIDDAVIDDLPAERREIGIVFQNYALFPHMTVADNVAYGLAVRRVPVKARRAQVLDMLETVQMQPFAARYPRELSGGQQQRVALARALVLKPKLLLLDEPFAALDKNLRLDMQIEIRRLQGRFGLTAIMVTHDQGEAMSISDRIAVMNRGRIEQLDTPVVIYDRPATLFVNSFVGSCSLLDGRIEGRAEAGYRVKLAQGASVTARGEPGLEVGDAVVLSVRPEQLALFDTEGEDRFPVEILLSLPMAGNVIHDAAAPGGTTIKVESRRAEAPRYKHGSRRYCGLSPGSLPNVFHKT
jgi:putative spermidine/putrescine transport system ATP-binding protein